MRRYERTMKLTDGQSYIFPRSTEHGAVEAEGIVLNHGRTVDGIPYVSVQFGEDQRKYITSE